MAIADIAQEIELNVALKKNKRDIMKKLIIAAVLVIFGAAVTAPDVSAHGGRTDKSGCHKDNKNGGRHCH